MDRSGAVNKKIKTKKRNYSNQIFYISIIFFLITWTDIAHPIKKNCIYTSKKQQKKPTKNHFFLFNAMIIDSLLVVF